MNTMEQEEAIKKLLGDATPRPTRDRVFYANVVNWIFSENQEAILDFKLVMPEDFRAATPEIDLPGVEGVTAGSANVNLDRVPVEVRYMPYNQFQRLVLQMALIWKQMSDEDRARVTATKDVGKPPSSKEDDNG